MSRGVRPPELHASPSLEHFGCLMVEEINGAKGMRNVGNSNRLLENYIPVAAGRTARSSLPKRIRSELSSTPKIDDEEERQKMRNHPSHLDRTPARKCPRWVSPRPLE